VLVNKGAVDKVLVDEGMVKKGAVYKRGRRPTKGLQWSTMGKVGEVVVDVDKSTATLLGP
jgi:hypothetical protein